MSLLNPLALGLAALSIPIVLMYILKLRRKEQVISSTVLWQRALEDVQANAPWQRLRPNILLLLQLLALAAIVLALAGPAYTRASTYSGDLVLIVDESYGMQAHDVSPSRFAVALREAHTLASEHGSGNVVSVIGMGAQPVLKIAASSNGGAVDHAIDTLQVGVSPPNFLGALSLASSLGRSGQPTRIVVLTSRESGISTLPSHVPAPTEIVRIGANLHDLGITAFSATPMGGKTSALLRVSNFGNGPENSDLNLYVDNQLVDVRPLSIDAGKVQNLFWNDLGAHAKVLRATLVHRDDVTDDKNAWAVVSASSTRQVLLVTAGDPYLQTALSLDPSVVLSTVKPSNYDGARVGGFDLIIFDGWVPAALPRSGPGSPQSDSGLPQPDSGGPLTSTLIVGPPDGSAVEGMRTSGYLPAGTVTPATSSTAGVQTSLLRYVDLGDVHVARAHAVSLPSWLLPVAVSSGTTLLAAGENGTSRLAIMTFSLQESDWPLRISFPILMQNLLHYLVPGLALGAANTTAGGTIQFYPPPGARDLTVTRPDGSALHLAPPFAPFTDTAAPGLYTVDSLTPANRAAGEQHTRATFAVNFFPARPAPAVGPARVWLGSGKGPGNAHAVSVPQSVAWAFMALVLLLLSAEWWFAFRR